MTLEVSVCWGDELIEHAHVAPGTPVVVAGVVVTEPSGRVGLVDYTIREIPRPARSLPYARGRRGLLAYIAGALALHLGLWHAAAAHAPPAAPAATAGATRPMRPARIGPPAPARATPLDALADDHARDTKAAGSARAMKQPAGGRAATRDHVAVQNTGEEPQLSKAERIAQARQAGVLGSRQVLDEAVQNLAGADRLTSAFDQITATGGTTPGGFGLERVGFGPGGGGTEWGTIGVGNAGAFSGGTGRGHGWGGAGAPRSVTWDSTWSGRDYSYAYVPYRRIGSARPRIVAVCPQRDRCRVDGAVEEAIVRRHVRRNIQSLEYCYEKERLAHPELPGGEVTLDFAIRGDGAVGDIAVAGIDVEVSSCVAGVVAKLQLPARGVTQVRYVLVYTPPPPAAPGS